MTLENQKIMAAQYDKEPKKYPEFKIYSDHFKKLKQAEKPAEKKPAKKIKRGRK